ncbi:MAG: transketolase [Bacteroidales bacterium]|nr:transketolase [Bacteroidales bacterium]
MKDIKQLQDIATQIRRDVLRMVNSCASGHPGGSLGCADLFTALYFNTMNVNPENFTKEGNNEDVFFLSIGHIAPVWYSALARRGYFPVNELSTLRQLGSRLQGHPSAHAELPGVRAASGSLGQGMSVGIGAALAKKMDGDTNLVYTLHGDGEIEEGQIWEAAMFAGAKHVDNLVSIIDVNGVQIDGRTDDVCSSADLKDKFTAFGWDVLTCNGNDMQELVNTLEICKQHAHKGKPVMLLMNTKMGFGVDFMYDNNSWHGKAPNDEQTVQALAQLEQTLGDY